MHLSALWVYPVKSCRGISLSAADVVATGLAHDRMWMVVDERGRFVSQREAPRLATVEAAIEGDALALSHREHGEIRIPVAAATPADRSVTVWDHEAPAHDLGDDTAAWFSTLLARPVRLVRMPDDHHRPVGSAYAGSARTAFSDGYPLLATSEASLAALNDRLESPVPMDRFRPNLVIAGAAAHAEDEWTNLRVGALPFAAVKPCSRCVTTTVDQRTGETSETREPLRTLAEYRRQPGGVMFGQNLVHLDTGRLQVGDPVVPDGS